MGPIVSDGGDDGEASATIGGFDGTTGKPCKADTDCAGPGGPGVNRCSTSLMGTVGGTGGVSVALLPTPACVLPTCDPAPAATDPTGMFLHYCDGPKDDMTSPGLCLPPPSGTGPGLCLPACSFKFDGSAPTGCIGNDVCIPIAETTDQLTGAVIGGIGFCEGLCEKDSDCSALGAGWVCQVDIGYCTQHPRTRTKQLGDACTSGTNACNCLTATGSTSGFCTSACIVGGTVPCPNGWVCDNGGSTLLNDGTPVTKENPKTAGTCFPPCTPGDAGVPEAATPEASAPADGSAGDAQASTPEAAAPASCPAASTCQSLTPLGYECSP